MNEQSLSKLYERLTRANQGALDAGDLVAATAGALANERRETVARALAESAAQAKLAHVLRDLADDSDALASDLARLRPDAAHRRPQRTERRIGASRRRFAAGMRWAAGMAACLVAVVGLWTLRHAEMRPAPTSRHALVRADVIFSARDTISNFGMDGPKAPAKAQGDHLFSGDFAGG
jgi:hypothetical protein